MFTPAAFLSAGSSSKSRATADSANRLAFFWNPCRAQLQWQIDSQPQPTAPRHGQQRRKDPRLLCQGSAIALGTARSVEEVSLDAHHCGEDILIRDAVEASRAAKGVGLEHRTKRTQIGR